MIGMRKNVGVAEALVALRPGSEFAVRDNSYESIEWFSKDIKIPTKEEVEKKVAELKEQEPMEILKEIRNWYLESTDWTQGADIRKIRGPEWCAAWDTYRQELRDLTKQKPYFTNPQDMHVSGVVWPKEPDKK